MGYRKHLAMIFAVSLLLTMAVGCHHKKDKPIWEQLEEAQYNSYKPRLDHMIEKYGDMFEMDVYGTITCTEPEYKDWRIACDATDNYSAVDNFAIRLRREDLELFMQEIVEPIFGECKVYVVGGGRSILNADAEIEDFFTYAFDLVQYAIWVPYTENYRLLADELIETIMEHKYKLHFNLMFVEEERYADVSRDWRYGYPDKYKYRLEVLYRGDYKMGPDYYGSYGKIWKERKVVQEE